jgi:hypothetical protein
MRRREPWIRRAFSPNEEGSRSFRSKDRWITAGEDSSADGRLWDQYAILVDLYKFYIDMTWKVSVGYYAAVGIAFAYYFQWSVSGWGTFSGGGRKICDCWLGG